MAGETCRTLASSQLAANAALSNPTATRTTRLLSIHSTKELPLKKDSQQTKHSHQQEKLCQVKQVMAPQGKKRRVEDRDYGDASNSYVASAPTTSRGRALAENKAALAAEKAARMEEQGRHEAAHQATPLVRAQPFQIGVCTRS